MTNSNSLVYLLKQIYPSPEASCSLPSEYLKHFNKARSCAPTWGAADLTSRHETKQALFPGGRGKGGQKRTALPTSSPPWSSAEIPMFPALIKFLKGKEEKKISLKYKSLKYDRIFKISICFKIQILCCLDYEIATVSSFT